MTPQEVLIGAADLLQAEGWGNVFIHEPGVGWSIFGALHHQLYPLGQIKDAEKAHAAHALLMEAVELVRPLMTWTNYGHAGWDMAPGMTGERAIAALREAAAL